MTAEKPIPLFKDDLAQRVGRLRAAGKPIPKAWGHIRPAKIIRGADLSCPEDVVEMTKGMVMQQLTALNREIEAKRIEVSAAKGIKLDRVCPELDPALMEMYGQRRRLKKLRKSAKRGKKKGPTLKLVRKISGPRVRVTRSVDYVYDETDNGRLTAFYASPEWKLMRYEALRLHGGHCQCCGASPGGGVVLNVDHIKPLRVFWELRLEIDNLQVLCGDCNEGKGARHADDWRSSETQG